MDEQSREIAAKAIIETLPASRLSNEQKSGLIYMIRCLKKAALVVEPDLLELRDKNTDLVNVINQALIGTGSKHAAEIFAYQLSLQPEDLVLRDLAAMGGSGREAGSSVLGLLDHESWNIRLAATRAIGYIDYKEAVPKLIDLLDDPSNVKINWAAAESLGRLRDKAALTALENTSKQHWYPAVRESSKKAINNIHNGKEYVSANAKGKKNKRFFLKANPAPKQAHLSQKHTVRLGQLDDLLQSHPYASGDFRRNVK